MYFQLQLGFQVLDVSYCPEGVHFLSTHISLLLQFAVQKYALGVEDSEVKASLSKLEAHLTQQKACIVKEKLSLADVVIWCTLYILLAPEGGLLGGIIFATLFTHALNDGKMKCVLLFWDTVWNCILNNVYWLWKLVAIASCLKYCITNSLLVHFPNVVITIKITTHLCKEYEYDNSSQYGCNFSKKRGVGLYLFLYIIAVTVAAPHQQ